MADVTHYVRSRTIIEKLFPVPVLSVERAQVEAALAISTACREIDRTAANLGRGLSDAIDSIGQGISLCRFVVRETDRDVLVNPTQVMTVSEDEADGGAYLRMSDGSLIEVVDPVGAVVAKLTGSRR